MSLDSNGTERRFGRVLHRPRECVGRGVKGQDESRATAYDVPGVSTPDVHTGLLTLAFAVLITLSVLAVLTGFPSLTVLATLTALAVLTGFPLRVGLPDDLGSWVAGGSAAIVSSAVRNRARSWSGSVLPKGLGSEGSPEAAPPDSSE
jgi:hypothetical protein